MTSKPYYRFSSVMIVKAADFAEAKRVMQAWLDAETEDPERWSLCKCVGFSHWSDCPENPGNSKDPNKIPF